MPASARIVLSHPGTGVFVQQAGQALFEAGMLEGFFTTVVDRPGTRWRRWAARSAWLDLRLRRRTITTIPTDLVTGHPARELLRLLVRGFDPSGVWTDIVWEWAEYDFDSWVARHGLERAQAVYAYEHAAWQTFRTAKERGIRCIYDVPAPEGNFMQRVHDEEIAAYPELDSPYQRHVRKHEARRTARRRQEWQAADVVVVGSEFSKSTYAAAGLDVLKARVVPPGAPPVIPEDEQREVAGPLSPLRCLFVGVVALHKGVHHLLAAWKRLRIPPGGGMLEFVGEIMLPSTMVQRCPESVHFTGRLRSDEILQRYREADILVFPALCDGFGMVVTEAFSQGLPVLTTPRAGAAELVRPGINGMIVPAADPEALAEALDWCLTHRDELHAMRVEARATAAAWQWRDYRRALVRELLDSPVFETRASNVISAT